MMPDIDPAPRDAWSYYYSRGTAAGGGDVDTRRIFLVVYFDDDRYDGYQWFSTLPEHVRYRP